MVPGICKQQRTITKYKDSVRKWCYIFPDLETCRKSFEKVIGTKIEWNEFIEDPAYKHGAF